MLLKLSHFQSSLADIENALKTRCTSPKVSDPANYSGNPLKPPFLSFQQAHYLRALALSGLGRLEEALFNGFLAICLDKNTNLSNSEIFQHDLAKVSPLKAEQLEKESYLSESPLLSRYCNVFWHKRPKVVVPSNRCHVPLGSSSAATPPARHPTVWSGSSCVGAGTSSTISTIITITCTSTTWRMSSA